MQALFDSLGIALNYTREMLIATLIMARTMTMISLTPFVGGKLVPTEVKIGLGIMMTVLLWPIARDAVGPQMPVTALPFLALMLKEVFVGFAIGFANVHIYWAMEMAGRMIDTARMTSMSEVMVPHSGERATPFGDMYYQILLVIFVAVGGHHIFFEAYFYSFASIPVDKGLDFVGGMGGFFEHIYRLTGNILLIATVLSAPIVAATLIADVVFGILNRVAPQLNAYFMSMPVKALGGVIMALLIMDQVFERFYDYALWALQAAERTIATLVVLR
ncbi:MAG: flagellar biosynthetic protein FliR [Myxococcota bacterium]